jgi:hypothetical protein
MNDYIAFDKIRGDFAEGQRGAFEELVSQLARRNAENSNSFRRIHGAGGDGGVECIHSGQDCGLVGYQAKYHTKAADIDWNAIEASFKTALSIYPNLNNYVIAIPCDFTGRRRVKGGAISEGTWGQWDRYVRIWQGEANKIGRSIKFVPWTAHELRAQLSPVNAAGLRAFWFNAVEFSHNWFKTHVHLSTLALDER